MTKDIESQEPAYKEMVSAFDELKKVAEKIEDVSDLPEEVARVEKYKQRWETLKQKRKDQDNSTEQYVQLQKKYCELREKLHNGVPKQIDDSLKDILNIGANTKTTSKHVKRVEVRVLKLFYVCWKAFIYVAKSSTFK